MKLSQLIIKVKNEVPNIKESGITDQGITDILNEGCDEVNLLAKIYYGYTDFDIAADTFIYNLSSIAPTYLGMIKAGLWIEDSNSVLKRIIPKTAEWLNKRVQNWRQATSGTEAQYYSVDGDELLIYPPLDTANAGGGRLYHLKKATVMASSDHYPWSGSATELTYLRPMDNALAYFVRWKLTPALAKNTDSGASSSGYFSWKDFINEVRRGAMQVKRRPDLTSDDSYRLNI